jgi:cytochrome c5
LTDVEVASAVVYMANAAGAKFKDAAGDTAAAAAPEAPAQEGSAPVVAAAEQQVAAAKPAAAAPQAGRGGEEVYKSACAACHGTGVLGAPKYQDKAAWEKRIAQGYKVLLNHALSGFNSMPARGGVANLSDLEVAEAVVYMANAAGASFKPTLP